MEFCKTHPLTPSAREGEQRANPSAREGNIWICPPQGMGNF
ncbi:hypothetical protein [Helicobacter sp. T3_23-1059]